MTISSVGAPQLINCILLACLAKHVYAFQHKLLVGGSELGFQVKSLGFVFGVPHFRSTTHLHLTALMRTRMTCTLSSGL